MYMFSFFSKKWVLLLLVVNKANKNILFRVIEYIFQKRSVNELNFLLTDYFLYKKDKLTTNDKVNYKWRG